MVLSFNPKDKFLQKGVFLCLKEIKLTYIFCCLVHVTWVTGDNSNKVKLTTLYNRSSLSVVTKSLSDIPLSSNKSTKSTRSCVMAECRISFRLPS